jgi:hypothetical protein
LRTSAAADPGVVDRSPDDDPEARQAHLLRAVLSGATLVMVALSWPLWIDLEDFPAVPLVRWFPDYPRSWSWLGLGLIALGLGLGTTRRWGPMGVGLAVVAFSWLILGDQLRLQPWVYQFLVLGTLLVLLPPRSALAFGRVWMASIYFHSGLSKLDASFAREMGPLFVRALARALGLGALPMARLEATAFLMPVAEIVVAGLLLVRPTRRLGYVGALLIHAALLLILGPWGLGHSTIVLAWNVALAVEEYVLFWPRSSTEAPALRFATRAKLVAIPFGLLLILPLGERLGLFDSWPSHALYAGHSESTTLYFSSERHPGLPADLRVAAQPTGAPGSWILRPTDWTRRVRGVPAYPQIRYTNGLAEWIFSRIRGDRTMGLHVAHRLRAEPWTGGANTLSARDLKEARELSDQFWFNAHPRDRSH